VIGNTITGTDAACIVFAHSALDAHLSNVLRVIATVEPGLWKERLNKRQAQLAAIEAGGYKAVYHSELMGDLARLDKESIPYRMKVLFEKCPGERTNGEPPGYEWNAENLERIDRLRHSIVHNAGITAPKERHEVEDDFDYLLDTGFYVLHVLKRSHGTKLGAAIPVSEQKP
jgi:hypothetical protein